MYLINLIKLDVKLGIWKKKRYLILIIISLICFCVVRNWKIYFEASSGEEVLLTLADSLALTFKGCIPFGKSGDGSYFTIPFLWFLLVLSLLLLPLDYPVSTLELWGYPYFLGVGKQKWWISKYLFTIISISTGFFIVIVTHLLCCRVFGFSLTLQNTDQFFRFIFAEMNLQPDLQLKMIDNLILTVILPLSGFWAMGLLEVLLSITTNVYFAFLVVVSMIVCSFPYDFCLLPTNSIMTVRSQLVVNEGTKIITQLGVNLLICLFVFIIGINRMKRWDFISKKEKQK